MVYTFVQSVALAQQVLAPKAFIGIVNMRVLYSVFCKLYLYSPKNPELLYI